MTAPSRYPIPAATCRTEETILRSRFITTVGHADTVEAAKAFIAGVSEEFSDTNHNCWAYVVGPPGDTSRVGLSDAGEPHGTAGRPMLNVLLGSGVGDVVAVVTRKAAMEALERTELVQRVRLRVMVAYADVSPLKHSLPQFEAEVTGEDYGTDVKLVIVLPEEHAESFTEALAGMTGGKAAVERG
jgi:putative IMPACT (imprinted ancient) family translation regulator